MRQSLRWLVFVVKAIVSAALLAYLLNRIGIDQAASRALGLSAWAMLSVLALLLAYSAVSSLRWLTILRALGCRVTYAMTIRMTFVGAFFSQFLPTSVGGDAVRVWESLQHGVDLAKSVHSVLLERASYVVSVSLFAVSGAMAWKGGNLPPTAVAMLAVAFAASLTATALLTVVDRLPAALLPTVLRRSTDRIAQDSRALMSKPLHLSAVFGTALINQGLLVAAILVMARDMHFQLAAADCLALLPAVVLVTSLPISIAGWGVREYAMVTAFGYAGLPSEEALVLSVILALASIVVALPGAAFWLSRRRRVAA